MPKPAPLTAKHYNLTALLGDLGLLPFILLAGLMTYGHFTGPGVHTTVLFSLAADNGFIAYSAVILSFLSGALWERSRLAEIDGRAGLTGLTQAMLLLSNLVTLGAWVCLLLIQGGPIMRVYAMGLLVLGFLTLLWVERQTGGLYAQRDAKGTGYWSMRLRITTSVVLLHALVAALMLAEL